jgi:hypothetical protein
VVQKIRKDHAAEQASLLASIDEFFFVVAGEVFSLWHKVIDQEVRWVNMCVRQSQVLDAEFWQQIGCSYCTAVVDPHVSSVQSTYEELQLTVLIAHHPQHHSQLIADLDDAVQLISVLQT